MKSVTVKIELSLTFVFIEFNWSIINAFTASCSAATVVFILSANSKRLILISVFCKMDTTNLLEIAWNRFALNPFVIKSSVSLHISMDTEIILEIVISFFYICMIFSCDMCLPYHLNYFHVIISNVHAVPCWLDTLVWAFDWINTLNKNYFQLSMNFIDRNGSKMRKILDHWP